MKKECILEKIMDVNGDIKMSENTKDLKTALWNSANVMRGTMGAEDYKSYLLGLIFINICLTSCFII